MKKLILIPALMLGSLALAKEYKYEISPMIGYNITEGNSDIQNDSYSLGSLAFQYNIPDSEYSLSKYSVEFAAMYSSVVDYVPGQDYKVGRLALNGVYTYEKQSFFTPFAKLGLGYEDVEFENPNNKSAFFADLGVGAKVPLTEDLSFKLEATYLLKDTPNSNLILLAGFNLAFGEVPPRPIPVPVPEVIEIDTSLEDDDTDGVQNSNDKCANTPANTEVDADGCEIAAVETALDSITDMELNEEHFRRTVPTKINFEYNSYKVNADSVPIIGKYAKFLNYHTGHHAKIVGYTDSVGRRVYNQELSELRANEVKIMLIDRKVSPSQVSSLGMGEDNPIADNDTPAGRDENRRIEIELSK